jgi:O-antigen/teichoic acid export membrane protein
MAAAATDGLLRKVMANAGLLLGGRTINALLSLGYMALAARALGISEFGVLVLINTIAQFVGEVAKFQSWQTVLQYGAKALADGRRGDFQRVVRFSLLLDLLSAGVGVLIGAATALFLGPHLGLAHQHGPLAALYAVTIVFMVPATPMGLLRLFDRFDLISGQAAVSSAVRLAGSGIAFLMGAPVAAFLIVWGAGTLAAFLYLTIASYRELHRRDLLSGFDWTGPLTTNMPGAWRFAWATNFSSSLDVAFTHVATLAVGAFLGPVEAALWRVARQIADALAKPARLLIPALYPELAKLRAARGLAAMQKLALHVGLIGGGGATVMLLVAIFAGEALLTLIMGPSFGAASETMTWQVAAAVIGVWALPLEPMLVSLGEPGAVLRVRLVVALVYIAALGPLIHAFGLRGAGAGLAAASGAMGLGLLLSLGHALRRTAPNAVTQ